MDNEENKEIKDKKPKGKHGRALNVAARLFIVFTVAFLFFTGVIYISLQFLMPFYYGQSRGDKTLTPQNYIEKWEREIELWKEEHPGGDAAPIEEITASFKEKYEKDMQQPYRDTFAFMRVVLILTVACFAFGLYFYARGFARPLKKLNGAAKKIAALDFDHELDVERSDEIGQLADSVRDMSLKLKTALTELKERNEQLQNELRRERELDVMRKKFVSDVSHELKTPLSIIGGYAEALKIGVDGRAKRKDYSAVIIGEVEKMSRLVSDLLSLSKYESAEYRLNRIDFDMGELLNRITVRYGDIFQKNGIRLVLDAGKGAVNADPDRIEQCVNNFLNNAVSHADGERIVYVKGETRGGVYRVSVVNSGEHIAAADIGQIWDSFYRADKARKRSEGRFGIGLSIVRAVLTRHNAPYGVSNVTDYRTSEAVIESGVEFWFELGVGNGV